MYGLPSIGDAAFSFDGEVIEDDDTPISLDLEDDYLIDVKIDKSLYDAAVTARTSYKAPAASSTAPAAGNGDGAVKRESERASRGERLLLQMEAIAEATKSNEAIPLFIAKAFASTTFEQLLVQLRKQEEFNHTYEINFTEGKSTVFLLDKTLKEQGVTEDMRIVVRPKKISVNIIPVNITSKGKPVGNFNVEIAPTGTVQKLIASLDASNILVHSKSELLFLLENNRATGKLDPSSQQTLREMKFHNNSNIFVMKK